MSKRPNQLTRLPSLRDFLPKFYRGGPVRFYLPVLYDLVAMEMPHKVVAIGFGEGEPFFAFCQAAREQKIDCHCTAIYRDPADSEHDDAWQNGKIYGREFYADIAEFVSGAPVALAKAWADNDVDLLLIDDCDSGSMLRRELQAWKAKLTPGALVLFHGTQLERKDSPRAAWARFISRHAQVELHDGIGLGITSRMAPKGESSWLARLLANDPALLEIYRLGAEKIEADMQAEQMTRDNAALKARQASLDSVLNHRWRAQEIMDHQARALAELEERVGPLQRDRAKAQEIMDTQAAQLAALRREQTALQRDRKKAQEVMDAQAARLEALQEERDSLTRNFEALRRDRAKAQLVMDAQGDQLKQFGVTMGELAAQVEKLKTQVAEQKRVLKSAREACKKKGRCFEGPKQRRPISERIARELARGPRNLRKLWAPKTQLAPEKKTESVVLDPAARYQEWVAQHEPDTAALDRQRQTARSWSHSPKISLLVPVFNPSPRFLEEMLASVAAQTYENWEICLADASTDGRATRDILKRWETREPRVCGQRLERNLGISENTNRALAIAIGDFVALLDQDDLLAPFALFELAQAIRAQPDVDLFYSDEDRWSETGERTNPFFKPEWSPELLYACMYLGHLSAYRRSLVTELGGLRKEFDLSQDYDLALRASERAKGIHHIPHVLYHWREHRQSGSLGGKPEARQTNLAALADAMHRRNLPADIIEYPTANRARLKVARWPRVSVIIPTDSPARLQDCLRHLPDETKYPDLEIVIVTNSSLANSLANTRLAGAELRVVKYDKPFNFSAKSNRGAEAAGGERLIFFNDDVEATQSDWIQNLIEPLENTEVGAVAPKMLYTTGKIQHAGLVTGVRGLVGTAFHQQPSDTTMHANFAQSMRNVSALSGACLAMRREDFVRLGGFDEVNTPISHSDIDLCFKIRDLGMRCVYTPFVTMKHVGHESIAHEEKKTGGLPFVNKSSLYLLKRWAGYTTRDPFYPNNMRDWLFMDSPTPIRMTGHHGFAFPAESQAVLFVSHDLSRSGAPILLLHLARWCSANGVFVTVMSPEDGPLRHEFMAAGIPMIVDPLVASGHKSFAQLAREFDCVVANTIWSAPVVHAAAKENIPVIWWLHETLAGDHHLRRDAILRSAIPLADLIMTPSERTNAVYRPFSDRPVRRLLSGIPDLAREGEDKRERKPGPLRFLLLGSIEPRKGQDLFVQALLELPANVAEKAHFQIIGRAMDLTIARQIKSAATALGNLAFREPVSHAEAIAMMRDADVLVCASRDEAMPLTIIEAMSLGKAILSTKAGGISEILTDEEDALLVKPGEVRALSAAVVRLISSPEIIAELGKNARASYEKHFTLDRFGADFLALAQTVIGGRNNLEPQSASSVTVRSTS